MGTPGHRPADGRTSGSPRCFPSCAGRPNPCAWRRYVRGRGADAQRHHVPDLRLGGGVRSRPARAPPAKSMASIRSTPAAFSLGVLPSPGCASWSAIGTTGCASTGCLRAESARGYAGPGRSERHRGSVRQSATLPYRWAPPPSCRHRRGVIAIEGGRRSSWRWESTYEQENSCPGCQRLARPSPVVPCGVGALHRHRCRARRGLVARSPETARGTSTTPPGSASPTPATPTRRWWQRSGTGRQAAPWPAEHRLSRAGTAALRPPGAGCCRAGRGRLPVQLRLRGRGGGGEAGPRQHRPHPGHRLPLRLPRTHGTSDGADHGQAHRPCRQRAAARARSTTPTSRTATALRAALTTRRSARCDWEAQPGTAVPPGGRPRQGGRRSSWSRSSARAATSCRRRRSCRACARSPASTACCSSSTRSRPASAAPARCSRSSTRRWSPTSDLAKGIASRPAPFRRSWLGRELMERWPPAATAAPTAATWSPAPRPSPRSTSSRRRACVANAAERGAQLLAGMRAAAGALPRRRRCARPGPDGGHGAGSAGRGRRSCARTRRDQARPRRGARSAKLMVLARALRQRRAHHPAARDHRRRSRPRAGHPRRGAGGRPSA